MADHRIPEEASMKIATMLPALFLLVGGEERPIRETCTELKVHFEREVVKATGDPGQLYARVTLDNETCRPVGIAAHGQSGHGLWMRDDEFVRWETQRAGSSQWTSYIGDQHKGRPGPADAPLHTIQHGETLQLYVEIPWPLHDLPADTKARVFITDNQGWSRSSQEFILAEYTQKPAPDPGLDLSGPAGQ